MAAPSRTKRDLDKFKPLFCCDPGISPPYKVYESTYQHEFRGEPPPSDLRKEQRHSCGKYKLKLEGVKPAELLTSHHWRDKKVGYNTQYGEDYNNLPRRNILPPIRHFHNGKWCPEKSDHPMIGNPWNYGYAEFKRKQAEKILAEETSNNYRYIPESKMYRRYDNGLYIGDRYATPAAKSGKFFNSKKGITRGKQPYLFTPNEVINESDITLPKRKAAVALSRRVNVVNAYRPIVAYPGEFQQAHRENRPPMVFSD